ncbi:MAG: protein translocase SEC61 complex subunit gamma [Candidatus Aenigmarchaeota archaeon]|nr:protein translocase SEC61 complex subunit gamma [Candidatus Aenigmarchaeota archaeon]
MNLNLLLERIRRVLLVSSKPDKIEFMQSLKITGIGMAVVGVVGFAIFLTVILMGGL